MIVSLPEPLARLVEQLQKLPGIGAKGAQRLAFHVLKNPREDAELLCEAIRDVKEQVTYCSTCNNITAIDPCMFCTGASRDHRIICVVEEPQNVMVVEKTREFRGLYHVLMGTLSPLHGVGPDDLKIKGLLDRVGAGGGMVTVKVNGTKQLESITLDPEVVSKDDVEMLQDMIVAAVNDAGRKVDEQIAQSMGGLMGGLKIPGL